MVKGRSDSHVYQNSSAMLYFKLNKEGVLWVKYGI